MCAIYAGSCCIQMKKNQVNKVGSQMRSIAARSRRKLRVVCGKVAVVQSAN